MTTKNQQIAARSYQPEFKELLQAVFKKQSYFADFFGGGIEALDGVQFNENAFYVKTSDIPVVVGTAYDTGENVAFGTGTGKTTRFGDRTEIIYTDTPVTYSWEWVFHEGIDRHTVNNDFEAAVSDRLELQAQAKTQTFNKHHSSFITATAGKTFTLEGYTADDIKELFNETSKYFTQIESIGTRVAKVTSDIYNAIVDHQLTTTGKNSTVNIDNNEVVKFKGFLVQEVPDSMFTGTVAYFYIAGVGKAFTGINTARTFESEDFDGQALQGAGKAGEFILDDNKRAVVKVIYATPAEGE
ncbi:phage capsid protein [Listeria innocua]|uniref:phage capsid protein n=1 Tax=Listeria innocua TaxID=1642 RepID=UPI001629A45E|nr:phage capsid protein [Listeria innocua]MBC2134046.1 phage capsid protein [Listeria innocua]